MDAFELTTPIRVFGQSVMRICPMSDWIVVALPAAIAEGVIARQHLAHRRARSSASCDPADRHHYALANTIADCANPL